VDLLVVVDVTLSVGVSLLGSLKGDADEVLSENVIENAGTQATVLLKPVESQQGASMRRTSYFTDISLITSNA
jgi:hypothetical protein